LAFKGRFPVKTSDLVIAANTVWVVFAAVLVMFMQAGFAFLEAGLTRMKNAAHISRQQTSSSRHACMRLPSASVAKRHEEGNQVDGGTR